MQYKADGLLGLGDPGCDPKPAAVLVVYEPLLCVWVLSPVQGPWLAGQGGTAARGAAPEGGHHPKALLGLVLPGRAELLTCLEASAAWQFDLCCD